MRAVFIGFLLLLGLAGRADAECTVAKWRFVWDIETVATMVSDGSRCQMNLIWTAGKTEVHSVSIASPPGHGAASVSGLHVFYTPRNGFKGDDAFIFAIQGRRNATPSRATVRVAVTVR